MLRIIRIVVSVIFLVLITFYFVDFAGLLPDGFNWLTRIQFIPAILSLSLIVIAAWIILTLLFGRIYCSSVCPMGIFQDAVNRVSRIFKSKRQRRFRYSQPRTVLRYGMLLSCILTFAFSFPLVLGLLDPYSAYGRMITALLKPVYLLGNNLLESIFTRFDNYTFYQMDLFMASVPAFTTGLLTLLIIGYLAWKHGRTWCNTICPVGTLLGFLSKYSFLKIRLNTANCTGCGKCARTCKSSCINSKERYVDTSRCVTCFNCLDVCQENALTYTGPKAKTKPVTPDDKVNQSKRRFMAAGIATAAVAPKILQAKVESVLADGKIYYKREHPITPPGSQNHKWFRNHCTSCHLCVSKCPANILKPAFMEYSLGGMMQPTLNFEKGFCNFDCTLCADVCPNGAIKPLSVDEKHRTQIGFVVFLPDNCIVNTDGTNCGACSEHCPTQAVAMKPFKDGLTLPEVDTDICVGCGGCEYVCPTYPKAIYVEGNRVHKEAKPFYEPEIEEVELDGFGF